MKASRLIIPYSISCNPIIATAIGLPMERIWCCMPGTPARVADGFTLLVRNIQGFYVLDIELPPVVSTANAQLALTSASFPFLLVTPTHATVFVRGDTETVSLADDRVDARAFNDLVQQMLEPNRFGLWASLIHPEHPRLGEFSDHNRAMEIDELVDALVVRICPPLESGNAPLAIGPMRALTGMLALYGEGCGTFSILEGPRLAVMDLALKIALDAARVPKSTLVVDALHREVHVPQRLLLVDSGLPLLGKPGVALDDDLNAQFGVAINALSSLALSFVVQGEGSVDAICEAVMKWVLLKAKTKEGRGIVIILDADNVLNETGAFERLLTLVRSTKCSFVMTFSTDQSRASRDRPRLGNCDNWLVFEPAGDAYDVRVKSSGMLPPGSIGKFIHDPERGSWAEAPKP